MRHKQVFESTNLCKSEFDWESKCLDRPQSRPVQSMLGLFGYKLKMMHDLYTKEPMKYSVTE